VAIGMTDTPLRPTGMPNFPGMPESFPPAVLAAAGGPIAVATIDAVTHPAPLPVGEQMLVWGDGEVVGSVSSGCVDGDVYLVARRVLADGRARVRHYGPDGAPVAVTTCGGTTTIGIERLSTADGAPAALGSILARAGRTEQPPRLLLLGAGTTATALARIAGTLGFRTLVIDPRPAFATAAQVPTADRVICGWPQRILAETALTTDDAVVLLTHDDRYDSAALRAALLGGAGYVGALGSARTAARHRAELVAARVPDDLVAALHTPVGLSMGAIGPAEIAVSIAAELVTLRRRTG
jgi:xanthine dehydrogenase accessory factor